MQGETLAGYRLLRTLASGSRAHVYLGRATPEPSDDVTSSLDGNSSVALKHFHRADDFSVATEVEALSLAANDHVVRLIDIATRVDQRRCLVLELLPNGSLARLLERRESIAAGEVVTIVAPLALAMDSFHQAGVVHGRIRASAVLFGERGAPVLSSFGRAQLITPGLSSAALTATPGVQADRSALCTLARTLLEHVDSEATASVHAWLRDVEDSSLSDGFGYQLAERLFDSTEPTPVDVFGASCSPRKNQSVPLSFQTRAEASTPAVVERFRPQWLHSVNLPDWIETVVARVIDTAQVAVMRTKKSGPASPRPSLADQVRSVRPRLWFVAATVGISLVVATVLLGGESRAQPDEAARIPADNPTSTFDASEFVSEGDRIAAVVDGDDPVAAAKVLLSARARCLAELSVLCLDSVSQQGSTAMRSDVVRIRALSDGSPTEIDRIATWGLRATELALIERLGGSALVGVRSPHVQDSETASVLLMKGEAGWLLRSFIVPD